MRKTKIFERIWIGVGTMTLWASMPAHAALPSPTAPAGATGTTSTDWLTVLGGYIKAGAVLLGLALSVVGFLWIAWASLAKLNEVRAKKAEWGEFGLYVGAGAGVLLFITYLLNQAAVVLP